ncbi:MAG: DUF427 domain-containing protein [Cyclobacteriaceae bacterium]|nr:DUF427 domain-containing protein [Cyclobacteriaceae bacterium]MDH4297872.1 DUF427 domain-containing protein [Cyclobacteriaceae bacterium]MDH5251311.1 DUF427 domain-containing protein [Cyclobacteriaceae bacterium]
MKAIWNGQLIAESDDTVVIEGNHYFPESTLKQKVLKPSGTETFCYWKGTASYHSLIVDGKENVDAVWYYANPSEMAKAVKGRVAFWKGVQVVK